MKTLKVGIIGCGRISRFHAMPVAAQENATVVAVCDLNLAKAKQIANLVGGKIKTYTDYQKMIKQEKLDVVHICLPHYLHSPVAVKAMEMGCHVMTEKPMAISMEQGEAMVAAAKKFKKKLGVILQNRYNAGTQLVKQCLESGRLGKILSAKCSVTWCRPNSYYEETDWKGTWDKEGGGAIIDQALHTLDLMCWFCGYDIDYVDCSMANRDHQGVIEVEDCADGLIVFKNGVRASFWAMNYLSCDDDVEVKLICENGVATIKAEEGYIKLNDGREFSAKPNPADAFNFGGGPSYWGSSHKKEITDFYQCLGAGKDAPISGKEAYETMHRMIMAVYESGRTETVVNFDEVCY